MPELSTGHTVAIVLASDFAADRLAELSAGAHVWITGTPLNRATAERLWSQRPTFNIAAGVTTFTPQPLADILGTVDEHHAGYSSVPPYARLEVIGEMMTDEVRSALRDLGSNAFDTTPDGFVARR